MFAAHQFSSMISGDLMNTKTRGNDVFQRMGRVVGGASLLLLISAGLEFFGQHPSNGTSIAGVLLALFLALWLYLLGLGVLLFLSVWWFVKWRRVRVKRAAMSRYAPAEPRSRRLENPAQRDLQYLQQGVAATVPSRSTGESDDGNEITSLTRVA